MEYMLVKLRLRCWQITDLLRNK